MAMTIDEYKQTIGTSEFKEFVEYKDPLADCDFKIDENTMYEIKVKQPFNVKSFFFGMFSFLSIIIAFVSLLLTFLLLMNYLIQDGIWSDFTIYYFISTIAFGILGIKFSKKLKESKKWNHERIVTNPKNDFEKEIKRRLEVKGAVKKIKQSIKHLATTPEYAVELGTSNWDGKDNSELDFWIYRFAYINKADAVVISNSHVQSDVSGSGRTYISGDRYGISGSGHSYVKTTHKHRVMVTYYKLLNSKNDINKTKTESVIKKKITNQSNNTNIDVDKKEKILKSIITFERYIKKMQDYEYYKTIEIKELKESFDNTYKALDELNTYIELYLNGEHITIDEFIKYYKMAIGQKMKYNKVMTNEEFEDLTMKKYKSIEIEINRIKNKIKS